MKVIAVIFLLISVKIHAQTLSPFSTDKCSMFPEGYFGKDDLWGECCVRHDISYWMGGTKQDRKLADLKLKECVKGKTLGIVSWLMYQGVRVGGSPGLKTSWRWGYGWKGKPKYFVLSEEDKSLIYDELSKTDLVDKNIINEVLSLHQLN